MSDCNPKQKFKEVLFLHKILGENLKELGFDLDSLKSDPRDWYRSSTRAEFRRLRVQLTKRMKELDERLYC